MLSILKGALRQYLLPRLSFWHVTAYVLLVAAALANLRYGLELGQTNLEKTIAALASLGADFYNALGLVACAWAWKARRWLTFALSGFALVLTFAYSLNAGVGFMATSKDRWKTERQIVVNADSDRAAAKARIEKQLNELGPARSALEIQPQIGLLLSDKRAKNCTGVFTTKYQKTYCPKVVELRAELGRAETRGELESRLAELNKLIVATTDNKPFVASSVDPASDAISDYLQKVGVNIASSDIPHWQSILFVLLVVACGPICYYLAEERLLESRGALQPVSEPAPLNVPKKAKASVSPPQAPTPAGPFRPRLVHSNDKLPPLASKTLRKIMDAGGEITASSQNAMATSLRMSRTSLRRATDLLRERGRVTIDDSSGYRLAIA